VIEVADAGRVALLRLDRQEKRNALDVDTCRRLTEAVRAAEDRWTRVVVITGSGTSFCSGADFGVVYTPEFRAALYEMLDAVVHAPMPVIAAVNGPAIGAGTQLALAADLRIATPEAVFGVPTAKLGIAVDPWTIRRLSLLAGDGVARAMLLACEHIDAARALGCGLVQRVGPPEEAARWATEIAELAPLTVRYCKQVLGSVSDETQGPEGEASLTAAFEHVWDSRDAAEGRAARLERRPPRFDGR
jgi:enoyl-CoA hydratase